MKLGSLFDGSGGFPLAASMCGIEPIWASEVEPYPIAVTTSRFPAMKHLGDITKVNGAEIEPVDIITFGSPCQSLSVAGKREGIRHETLGDEETTRSGLFMEAIRIIKEMRGATNGRYPAFAVWENVQGAFSSNKGEDFRIVLEEFVKIVHPTAKMPAPDKKGWAYADIILADGFSLAYRLVDAQYWGVPQRRKRIYLVADFRGERAGKILFEREGLRGYFAQGRTPWQGAAADAEGCIGTDDSERSGLICFTPWDSQTRRVYSIDGIAPGLCSGAVTSGQNQQSFLIPVSDDSERNCVGYDGYNGDLTGNTSSTLGVNCGMSTGRNGGFSYNCNQVVRQNYIVRRLTPTECARLQGFPDKWGHPDKKDYLTDSEYKFWQDVRNTDAQINGKAVKEYSREQMLKWYNKLHSDSAEYKMWGNGIALPNALYVMQGIADALKSGDAE